MNINIYIKILRPDIKLSLLNTYHKNISTVLKIKLLLINKEIKS